MSRKKNASRNVQAPAAASPKPAVAAPPPPARSRKAALALAGALVIGAIIAAAVHFSGKAPPVATSSDTAPQSTLVRFHSPTLGSPTAKVHIVEFLDPACEGCRAFAPVVKALLDEYPDKVRLTVRYLAFHKGSDVAVRAMEAARKQGKFREAMDTLFASQPNWAVNHTVQPDLLMASLKGLGLNLDRLREDMASPDLAKVMEQDLADAKALKVAQTPEFFINGQRLQPFGMDELRAAVRRAVNTAYP